MGGQKDAVVLVLLRPYGATHCARTWEIAPGMWSGTFPKGSSICICLMFRLLHGQKRNLITLSCVSTSVVSGADCCGLWVRIIFFFAPDVILHESRVSLPPPTTTQYDLNSCNAKMNRSSEDAETWNAKRQHTKQMGEQFLREIRPLTASLGELFLNISFI